MKVARCLNPEKMFFFSKVPLLIRLDETITEGEAQKASKLFSTFYLLLPDFITEECETPEVTLIKDHEIEIKEVRTKVFSARP